MRKAVLSVIPILSVAVYASSNYQPLRVKVGLWETTTTTTRHGAIPVPPDLLARLTPDQRARIEAKLKADADGKTTTRTSKNCLTQAQLEDGRLYENRDLECKQTIDDSTPTTLNAHWDCAMDSGVKGSGQAHFEAASPTSVSGAIHISFSMGGHPVDSETTMSSKWLGPACGDVR